MIDVPRSTTPAAERQPPLTWRPVQMPTGRSASFVCSNGHDGTLLDHEIAADGTVTPSVVCDGIPAWPTRGIAAEGCDFHDHLRLVGW